MSEPLKPPQPPQPPRQASNPNLKAFNAARMAPLSAAAPSTPVGARLKEGAADTALNAVSILRDVWGDFRRSDQFFKYKAFIIAGWLALSGTTFAVACPGSAIQNSLSASVTMVMVTDTPHYRISNDGDEAWEQVAVLVNGKYQASAPRVDPGSAITLGPKQLIGPNGTLAPDNIRVNEVVLKTQGGEEALMENGQLKK